MNEPLAGRGHAIVADPRLADAGSALRELILAGEHYRLVVATYLGLTVSESQAVSYLLSRGPMGQTDLGAALAFTTSSTTALVDRLERKGVVERLSDPTDRRRSTVQVSAEGEQALRATRDWITHAFDHVSLDRLTELSATLRTIAMDMRAHAADIPAAISPAVRPKPRRRR